MRQQGPSPLAHYIFNRVKTLWALSWKTALCHSKGISCLTRSIYGSISTRGQSEPKRICSYPSAYSMPVFKLLKISLFFLALASNTLLPRNNPDKSANTLVLLLRITPVSSTHGLPKWAIRSEERRVGKECRSRK